MVRLVLALGLLAAAAGCRGGSKASQADAGASTLVQAERKGPRPAWPTDAPSASACQKDDDCTVVVWDGPQPPDPCCDERVGYLPVARAHLAFIEAFRKAHCVGATCPPSPFPGAEPACCASIARCVERKCVSACELAGEAVPKISVLDPACDSFKQAPRDGKPVEPPR